jgi:hypothetical protein
MESNSTSGCGPANKLSAKFDNLLHNDFASFPPGVLPVSTLKNKNVNGDKM